LNCDDDGKNRLYHFIETSVEQHCRIKHWEQSSFSPKEYSTNEEAKVVVSEVDCAFVFPREQRRQTSEKSRFSFFQKQARLSSSESVLLSPVPSFLARNGFDFVSGCYVDGFTRVLIFLQSH
jgi:hypothetical protein